MSIPTPKPEGNTADDWLPEALAYAARGWSIIPVIGKKAAGLWKPFQTSTADDKTLRRLFAKKDITGLAVILGRVSGSLAVRDFDDAGAYHAWANANPDDAANLPTVRTCRGFHLFGRLDEEAFADLGDGELRADSRHYVVLPPSVHPSGAMYSWVNPLPQVGTPLPLLPSSATQRKQTQEDPAHPSKPIACAHPSPSLNSEMEKAITKTLPSGPGQRNRRLFDLARELKRIMPDAKPDALREIVREWYRRALPVIGTKEFSESWSDFALAWREVKWPAGCSLQAAMATADRERPPGVAEQYDGDLRRLASLCWQLQIRWGDRPFPLGCRLAAELLGVHRMQAWRMFKTLQFDEILRLVKKGTKPAKRASEWRFVGGANQ